MARKTKTLTIDKGRDEGKTFLITEMPLLKADKWASKALFALMRGGQGIEGIDPKNGMMEMAKVAISAFKNLNNDEGMELINELLFDCVQIVPTGGEPRQVEWESEVEDISTMFNLRLESFKIHIDFLIAGSSLITQE